MDSLHSELQQQLANAGDSLVRAVVQLRAPAEAETAPDAVVTLAHNVLDRVTEAVGHKANRTNVLKNINSVIIESNADFLREMIKQPEVVSAVPSHTTQDMRIRPVHKKAAPAKKPKKNK